MMKSYNYSKKILMNKIKTTLRELLLKLGLDENKDARRDSVRGMPSGNSFDLLIIILKS